MSETGETSNDRKGRNANNKRNFTFLMTIMVAVLMTTAVFCSLPAEADEDVQTPSAPGDMIWANNLGGSKNENFTSVIAVSDGLIAVGNLPEGYTCKYPETLLNAGKDQVFDAAYTESVNHESVTGTVKMNTSKAPGAGSVTMDDWTHSGTVNDLKIDNPNGVPVTVWYKEYGADDSMYTSVRPSEIGKYTVKVTFGATENYEALEVTADFMIFEGSPDGPSDGGTLGGSGGKGDAPEKTSSLWMLLAIALAVLVGTIFLFLAAKRRKEEAD
ncbi:MAG: hypothetical protein LBV13_01985 [Methanomassiliicoccaceae archaeon]|jgi:hypothetical protein|nr:hypothetical protein [Methanomassiliicoccaceae archaeon]